MRKIIPIQLKLSLNVFLYTVMAVMSVLGYFLRPYIMPAIDPAENALIGVMSFGMFLVTFESMRFLNRMCNRYLPFERYLVGRIALQLSAGLVLMLTIRYIIFDLLKGKYVHSVETDHTFKMTTYVLYFFLSFVLNFAFFAEYFFKKWKQSIQRAERLEKEKAVVQFDNLRNKLNPHFLFNALSSLNSLIFDDQELASQFLQQLSRIYRYVLQNKDKDTVPLRTETDFIRNYITLLKIRFGKALDVNVDVREEDMEKGVVPVTLQALIENALKHNVVNEEKPLRIEIRTEGDYLVVSNNLQRKTIVEGSNKQGLENLRNLYGFLNERRPLVREDEHIFEVKLPLLG